MKQFEKQKENIDRPEKSFGSRAFNALNYLGLGWIANSTLSLYITYNLLPTKVGKKIVGTLAKTAEPVVKSYYQVFKPTKLGTMDAATHLAERARSATEILCMCIAGTLMLIPMKIMENYKKPIVDKLDTLAGTKPATDTDEPDYEKQRWGKLLWARVVAVGTVLGIDQLIQGFNNRRHTKGLQNLDTLEWTAGGKLYGVMKPSWRDRLIDFFSRKHAGVDSIQPTVRERIAKTVGDHPHKMVFAEQTRLFTKEVSLTLVVAGIVYAISKTSLCNKALAACGIRKKPEKFGDAAIAPSASVISEEATEKPGFAANIAKHADYTSAILNRQHPASPGLSA